MRKQMGSVVLYFAVAVLAVGSSGRAPAQAAAPAAGSDQPPKILFIVNEEVKTGKGGAHEKTEKQFAATLKAAKSPVRYLGMEAITGRPFALFLSGFDSIAELEKANESMHKNPVLSATLDKINLADGDLLSGATTSIYMFDPETSFHTGTHLSEMRYFEITLFTLKPGHTKEWKELASIYSKAFEAYPEMQWAVFDKLYGVDSDRRVIMIQPWKSLADVDQEIKDGDAVDKAFTAEEQKKIHELSDACIASSEAEIFAVNPKLSYEPEWEKTEPKFWGGK